MIRRGGCPTAGMAAASAAGPARRPGRRTRAPTGRTRQMERMSLVASARTEIGKNAVKKVRQAGLVPAVLYGRGRAPVALAVDRRALLGALRTEAGRNVLIDLRV